jgi:hypothetical protein
MDLEVDALVHPMEVNNPAAVNINAKYFIGSPLSGISRMTSR